MGKKGVLLPILLILGSTISLAGTWQFQFGGIAGNGGNVIFCSSDSDSGHYPRHYMPYSLDYVLTRHLDFGDLVPIKSVQDSETRIARILGEKAPFLLESFTDFIRSVHGASHSGKRVWISEQQGQIPVIEEPNIDKQLIPTQCFSSQRRTGSPLISQVVYRKEEKDDTIHYHFVQAITDSLGRTPLQFSFLMVHEWLWDYLNTIDDVRILDRFFHSSKIESMTPEDVRQFLEKHNIRESN